MYDGIVSLVDVSDSCTLCNAAIRKEECHDGSGQGNGFFYSLHVDCVGPSKTTSEIVESPRGRLFRGACGCRTGIDGGGSVRVPSALCGVVGLRPTVGRTSTANCPENAFSIMSFGAHTASMADAALVHAVISNAGGLAECYVCSSLTPIFTRLDPVLSTVASSTAFDSYSRASN
jgi:hypothetical protein